MADTIDLTGFRCGADMLWYARAVLADPSAQDGPTVAAACRIIEAQDPDEDRQAAACALRRQVEGDPL